MRTVFNPIGANIKIDITPIRFDYTGNFQEYIVPLGIKKLSIDCVGAKGFGTTNFGGRVQCILSVIPKQILYLYVGGIPTSRNTASYNASDIRLSNEGITNSVSLENRIIVAGGAGSQGAGSGWTAGAAGGGLTATAGANTGCSGGGQAGTQTSGGAGGKNIPWTSQQVSGGQAGTLGLGGNGGSNSGVGGAGGAGYYGGGGGAGGFTKSAGNYGAGGGGGSSYTNDDLCNDVIHTQNYENSNNGYIIIAPTK